MGIALNILDWVLFCLLGIAVVYLFIFSVASLRKRGYTFTPSSVNHRFVILIPAYKEDSVILHSVASVLEQDYPRESYEVVVIADKFGEEALSALSGLPVRLLDVDFENSSKAKALNYAVEKLGEESFDAVVILDADNTVERDFLIRMNDAYNSGALAVQAHRRAKNLNTDTAVLDAVSEEINNSVFRKGHVAMGISSALIGSGMMFDYGWFRKNVTALTTAGEDKELEVLLLKNGVFIEYLDDVIVLDEKTQKSGAFYNQRRRWLSAQFYSFASALKDFPGALFSGNIDYLDKMVQWMMPPRIILLGLVPVMCVVTSFAGWSVSLKWWILLLVLLFAMSFSIPDYLVDKKFKRALRKAPWLFVLMAANIFRVRGAKDKFIHTEHGQSSNNVSE